MIENEKEEKENAVIPEQQITEGDFPANFVQKPVRGAHVKVKNGKKIIKTLVLSFVGLLVVVYAFGFWFFSCHMMPNTTIGGIDVSWMKTTNAANTLNDTFAKYTCTISGGGFNYTVKAADISYKYDSITVVNNTLKTISQPLWFVEVFKTHEFEAPNVGTWSTEALTGVLTTAVDSYNRTASAPIDAFLAYDEVAGTVTIQEAVSGTQINTTALVASLKSSLLNMSSAYELSRADYIQPTVSTEDQRLSDLLKQISNISTANFVLTVDEEEVGKVDSGVIFSWLDIDENFNAKFNQTKMEEWIDSFIAKHSTVGTTRTYTRPDGKSFTVSGGTYGWNFNRGEFVSAIYDAVINNCVTDVEVPCIQKGDTWVAEEGDVDFGPVYIDIEVSTQRLRLITHGSIIHECGVISGDVNYKEMDMSTPYGVFYINAKLQEIDLIGYLPVPYCVHVHYWMSFVSNEIGIHDNMDRQQDQPSSSYDNPPYLYALSGEGSHGCVNVSLESATYLYEKTYIGLPVVVHW